MLCKDDCGELPPTLSGAIINHGDIFNEAQTADFLRGKSFDAVVNWIIFSPADIERDIRLFTGKTDQYIFVSTASAYEKPARSYIITERTPLANPHWEYSRKKIECEKLLFAAFNEQHFPATVVRPSLTYGDRWIPYHMASDKSWSLIDRIRRGKRVIVPGDGTSIWTITHNTDFAQGICGLVGNPRAVGEAFHITSDEVLTWNDILRQIGDAVGVEAKTAHISSEFILAFMPEKEGSLLGDKVVCSVFDNSKLKGLVPEFTTQTRFAEGIKRTVDFYDAHPGWQAVDEKFEAAVDKIIAAHDYGMGLAGR